MALDFEDDDEYGSGPTSFIVDTPSGASLRVQDQGEADYYVRLRDRILGAYEFTDPSDFSDLDRILSFELLVWRLQGQLGTGIDQHGRPLSAMDQTRIAKSLKETSETLAKSKDALGISKTARDRADDGETVGSYLDNLRARCLELGIHRNEQVHKALGLMNEIGSLASTWLRCNELERTKLGYPQAEDLLRWIAEEAFPEYQQIDAAFRANGQRYWIGTI